MSIFVRRPERPLWVTGCRPAGAVSHSGYSAERPPRERNRAAGDQLRTRITSSAGTDGELWCRKRGNLASWPACWKSAAPRPFTETNSRADCPGTEFPRRLFRVGRAQAPTCRHHGGSVAKRHMVMKAGKTAQTWQTAVGLGPAPVSMFHRVERCPVANERDVDELRDDRE